MQCVFIGIHGSITVLSIDFAIDRIDRCRWTQNQNSQPRTLFVKIKYKQTVSARLRSQRATGMGTRVTSRGVAVTPPPKKKTTLDQPPKNPMPNFRALI